MNSLFKIITNNTPHAGFTITGQSILVQDLQITMSIGVHDFEKETPQRVLISLELEIDENANPKSDHIDEVISYADIVEDIKALAASKHYELVETFAHDIASACLNSGPQAQRVSVEVSKPDILDEANVGVTIKAEK